MKQALVCKRSSGDSCASNPVSILASPRLGLRRQLRTTVGAVWRGYHGSTALLLCSSCQPALHTAELGAERRNEPCHSFDCRLLVHESETYVFAMRIYWQDALAVDE